MISKKTGIYRYISHLPKQNSLLLDTEIIFADDDLQNTSTKSYTSLVWDGCSVNDVVKVQIAATGLRIFVSKESLYFETDWESLKTSRHVAKCQN